MDINLSVNLADISFQYDSCQKTQYDKTALLDEIENISSEYKQWENDDNFFLVSIDENNNMRQLSEYTVRVLESKNPEIFYGVCKKEKLLYQDPVNKSYQLLAKLIYNACQLGVLDDIFSTNDGMPVVGVDVVSMKYHDYKKGLLVGLIALADKKLQRGMLGERVLQRTVLLKNILNRFREANIRDLV